MFFYVLKIEFRRKIKLNRMIAEPLIAEDDLFLSIVWKRKHLNSRGASADDWQRRNWIKSFTVCCENRFALFLAAIIGAQPKQWAVDHQTVFHSTFHSFIHSLYSGYRLSDSSISIELLKLLQNLKLEHRLEPVKVFSLSTDCCGR